MNRIRVSPGIQKAVIRYRQQHMLCETVAHFGLSVRTIHEIHDQNPDYLQQVIMDNLIDRPIFTEADLNAE